MTLPVRGASPGSAYHGVLERAEAHGAAVDEYHHGGLADGRHLRDELRLQAGQRAVVPVVLLALLRAVDAWWVKVGNVLSVGAAGGELLRRPHASQLRRRPSGVRRRAPRLPTVQGGRGGAFVQQGGGHIRPAALPTRSTTASAACAAATAALMLLSFAPATSTPLTLLVLPPALSAPSACAGDGMQSKPPPTQRSPW